MAQKVAQINAHPRHAQHAHRLAKHAVAANRPLEQPQWDTIDAEARRRVAASNAPCAICMQPFAGQHELLLSCSHTFHAACLRSWEAYAGERCCPVCRKRAYRRRATSLGADAWRERCAVALQAAWRGARARRRVASHRRELNPADARAVAHSLARLGLVSDRLVGQVAASHSEVDALFAELEGPSSGVAQLRAALAPVHKSAVDWVDAHARALSRGPSDCPICLAPMGSLGALAAPAVCCGSERLTLLSCSHVLHDRCLLSFEAFSVKLAPTCPVCRSEYAKLAIDGFVEGVRAAGCAECEPCDSLEDGQPSLKPPTAGASRGSGRGGRNRGRGAGRDARLRHLPASSNGRVRVPVAGRLPIPGVAFS